MFLHEGNIRETKCIRVHLLLPFRAGEQRRVSCQCQWSVSVVSGELRLIGSPLVQRIGLFGMSHRPAGGYDSALGLGFSTRESCAQAPSPEGAYRPFGARRLGA